MSNGINAQSFVLAYIPYKTRKGQGGIEAVDCWCLLVDSKDSVLAVCPVTILAPTKRPAEKWWKKVHRLDYETANLICALAPCEKNEDLFKSLCARASENKARAKEKGFMPYVVRDKDPDAYELLKRCNLIDLLQAVYFRKINPNEGFSMLYKPYQLDGDPFEKKLNKTLGIIEVEADEH